MMAQLRGFGLWCAAAALGTLCAATALAYSTVPGAWKNWRYSRAIDLPATDYVRLAEATVADEIYLRADPALKDLRIIDEHGNETPYAIFTLDGTKKTEHLAAAVHEKSFTPGEYTQAVIEIQGDAPFHNSLEIETDEQNFIEWVSVDASDDGRTWRIVEDRAPIFRFVKDGREGTRVVHYSENNARYLRVRIFDGDKRFPISGAVVFHETGGPEERVPIDAAQITVDPHPPRGQTVWTADLGGNGLPMSEIHFDVAPMEFVRCVNVASSGDQKEWRNLENAQIYRFHQVYRGEKVREQLTVPITHGHVRDRFWRITIENRNDAPLAEASVRLYTTPRHVVFEQQPGKTYSLLYGQERAPAAQYDLGQRVDVTQHVAAVPGKLGPEEVNAAWVDPRPWTETHEIFLWGVLGIAVLVIGFTAIQSLRRAAAEKTEA